MPYKIMLDAGHGGNDPGAVYGGRQEKDDNLRLAMAVGNILSQNGIDVVYTRTDDVYQSPIEKARLANASGADYFISFHRNSSPEPNQYSGVETLVYNQSGRKLTMAQNINRALENIGFKNLGVKSRTGLVVLRRTRMPALLIETGFINTPEDNERFDENFNEIARAIADAILTTLDVHPDSTGASVSASIRPFRL
jgi:N-acetylmuramoyl-L-alanine amidase